MLGLLGVDQPDHLIDDGSDTDFHQCNNRCFSARIYLQQSLLEVGMQSFPIPTHLDSIRIFFVIIQKNEENQSWLVSPTTWSWLPTTHGFWSFQKAFTESKFRSRSSSHGRVHPSATGQSDLGIVVASVVDGFNNTLFVLCFNLIHPHPTNHWTSIQIWIM